MKKDELVYVGHMLDTARLVAAKIHGIDRTAFDQDDNLRLALAHLIQTIGEAAARVSEDFRALHQDVPWRAIVGMRHKIVHEYIFVNYDIVWAVATIDVVFEPLERGPLAESSAFVVVVRNHLLVGDLGILSPEAIEELEQLG